MNTDSLTTKSRIAWIDVAKGICLISVIAGHLGVTEINRIVFSYHLTVFFILSGYTLKPVKLDAAYLNKKFRSLMIPYFITCACIAAMDVFNSLYQGGTSIETVMSILSKNLIRFFMASGSITSLGSVEIGTRIGAIWFLPALFFFDCFYAADFTVYSCKSLALCCGRTFDGAGCCVGTVHLAAIQYSGGYDGGSFSVGWI